MGDRALRGAGVGAGVGRGLLGGLLRAMGARGGRGRGFVVRGVEERAVPFFHVIHRQVSVARVLHDNTMDSI